jgi:hypothetical protein
LDSEDRFYELLLRARVHPRFSRLIFRSISSLTCLPSFSLLFFSVRCKVSKRKESYSEWQF